MLDNHPRIEIVLPSKPVLVPGFLIKPFRRCVSFYKNTIPILSALTPPEFNLSTTDESVESVKFKKDVDLLGISISTAFANRGYAIADKYRSLYNKHGKKLSIVFGGSHATARPEEALEHGDSVVLGEAESSWPELLSDFKSGQIKQIYPTSGISGTAEINEIPLPDREILDKKSFFTINAIQLSRGCPRACEFCSIGSGTKVRRISLDRVEDDVRKMKGKYLALLDDNFFGNVGRDHQYIFDVLQLFRKYKKTWFCQMPLYAGKDKDLLGEMVSSGCKGVYMGIDSVPKTLDGSMKKNRTVDPIVTIRQIKNTGLHVMAGFVFGFDSENQDVFDLTLRFAEEARLNLASFHILTPYPGTRLYDRLKSEGRLTHDGQWDLYDTANVVFQPKNMSPETLYKGFRYSIRKLYSWRSIIARNPKLDATHYLANAFYWFGVRPRSLMTNTYNSF